MVCTKSLLFKKKADVKLIVQFFHAWASSITTPGVDVAPSTDSDPWARYTFQETTLCSSQLFRMQAIINEYNLAYCSNSHAPADRQSPLHPANNPGTSKFYLFRHSAISPAAPTRVLDVEGEHPDYEKEYPMQDIDILGVTGVAAGAGEQAANAMEIKRLTVDNAIPPGQEAQTTLVVVSTPLYVASGIFSRAT